MSKKKNITEGLIITAIGVLFLILALSVSKNPIGYEKTWVNVVAQAKFLPIVMASAVTVIGIIMIIEGARGKMTPATYEQGEFKTLIVVVAIVAAYLLAINYFGFRWPTVGFSIVSVVYFNWGKKKWWQMLIVIAIYIVCGLIVLPKLIGLRLI